MSSDSMIYTIGTALNRALDNGHPVEVLVEGMWVSGHVLAVDGFGVVLHSPDDDRHSVIRIESVSAVTINAAAPQRVAIEHAAHIMPSPRSPHF